MSNDGPLIDRLGRVHNSLRVSVTDRCNIRCFYCMPNEHVRFKPRDELLSFEEIERFVRVVVGLGVHRVRITGGEPLMRGIADLGPQTRRHPRRQRSGHDHQRHVPGRACRGPPAGWLAPTEYQLGWTARGDVSHDCPPRRAAQRLGRDCGRPTSRISAHSAQCGGDLRDYGAGDHSAGRVRPRPRVGIAVHRVHATRCGSQLAIATGVVRGDTAGPLGTAVWAAGARDPHRCQPAGSGLCLCRRPRPRGVHQPGHRAVLRRL